MRLSLTPEAILHQKTRSGHLKVPPMQGDLSGPTQHSDPSEKVSPRQRTDNCKPAIHRQSDDTASRNRRAKAWGLQGMCINYSSRPGCFTRRHSLELQYYYLISNPKFRRKDKLLLLQMICGCFFALVMFNDVSRQSRKIGVVKHNRA